MGETSFRDTAVSLGLCFAVCELPKVLLGLQSRGCGEDKLSCLRFAHPAMESRAKSSLVDCHVELQELVRLAAITTLPSLKTLDKCSNALLAQLSPTSKVKIVPPS